MGVSASEFKYFRLTPDTAVEDVNEQYKRMVLEMHPDRGGTHEEFVAMQEEFKRAVLYVAARARSAAHREQAAALLAMVTTELIRDPGIVGEIIRRIKEGKVTEWLKVKVPDFLMDMGRSLVQQLLEKDSGGKG